MSRQRPGYVCLMYHNVVQDVARYANLSPSITSYFVTTEAFARQTDALFAAGGWCLRPDALPSFYAGDAGGANGYPVLLTFDDGWLGSVDGAGPALERHGCQALLFVTTGFVGRPHFLDRPRLRRLPRDRFLVGSHGVSHRMLSRLSEPEIRQELKGSKAFLEDEVGYAVETLSIPSGAVDERVRRVAAEVGYRFVFTSEVGVNAPGDDPLSIRRVALQRTTPLPAFRRYVRQRLGRERLRRWLLGVPKRFLGLHRYELVRRRLLGEARGQEVTHES